MIEDGEEDAVHLSLFQNLFGLAAGPFIVGALSDAVGLERALTLTPLGCVVAARRAYTREYEAQAELPVV